MSEGIIEMIGLLDLFDESKSLTQNMKKASMEDMPHTKRLMNDDIRERLKIKVENITERCRKARLVSMGNVKRRYQE